MGRAFSTGASPLDWVFMAEMLAAQGADSYPLVVKVATSVGPCVVNIVQGKFFGGISVVICAYGPSASGGAFNYVSVLGTQDVAEMVLDIVGAPLAPAPWLGQPLRGDVVSFFLINAYTLFKAVMTATNNDQPTVFAGHSLGGASCQIMASMFLNLGRPVLGCYTIGSPKPGSVFFANSLTCPVLNAQAVGDPIPSLPQIIKLPGLPWWLNGAAKFIGNATIWNQTGVLLTLGDDGVLRSDGGQQYSQLQILDYLNQFGFDKHLVSNYSNLFTKAHPTRDDLLPCASGYEKPWRMWNKPDPPFPPVPPAKIAPCVSPNRASKDFIYNVDYDGTQTLLSQVDDPPPTYPLNWVDPLPSPCCKQTKP